MSLFRWSQHSNIPCPQPPDVRSRRITDYCQDNGVIQAEAVEGDVEQEPRCHGSEEYAAIASLTKVSMEVEPGRSRLGEGGGGDE